MRADTGSGGVGETNSLYAEHKKVFPQAVKGRFRNIKWSLMAITLGIYYFLPFVRWDRGPLAPDQAVLVDLPGRRFYFFFIEIWPQEVYYFTGLLIIAAMTLFLMNAVAGRVWCGYLCWQTVWTDLFYAVEDLIEGDRRARIIKDKQPWSLQKLGEKGVKHFIWLMIAWWTGGAWVLYFADAPTLVKSLATGQAPSIAYIWIGILTFTTYIFAGWGREQVCTYMCPWPRIQASLTDEWALNVTYLRDRGEPRGSVKKMKQRADQGLPAGDCVDCGQCVAVCPTGIDIRDGIQLPCIQCGLCIDACDNVMNKIGRPTGLIAYDTDINIMRRLEGKPPVYKFIRVRTVIYVVLIALVGGIMLYTLLNRSMMDLNVLHDRQPLFVQLSEGGLRNGYTVRVLNKRPNERSFTLGVEGIEGARLEVVGADQYIGNRAVLTVDRDTTREFRVLVFTPADAKLPRSTPVTFRLTDTTIGEMTIVKDFFKAP